MIKYLLEASICLIGFYGFYWLFLKSEKLLSINRFYLLLTSCISMILPLLDFKVRSGLGLSPKSLSSTGLSTQEVITSTQGASWEIIYFSGLSISVLLFFVRLFLIRKRIGKHFSFNKKLTIVETDGKEAFSFFNTIFIGKHILNDAKLKSQILAHEIAHVKGRHLFDLIYFEVVQCLFWFNPFSYFYSKSIKLQHEYIADQNALECTEPKAYQDSLVRFTLSKVNTQLVSSFGQHPIQKRLEMIYKLNSNIMKKLKPLFALPILAALFIGISCSEETAPELDLNDPESAIEELEIVTEESSSQIIEGNLFVEEEIPVDGSLHLQLKDENGDYYEVEVIEEVPNNNPIVVEGAPSNQFEVEEVREEPAKIQLRKN